MSETWEFDVSNSDSLPQMETGWATGGSYNPINELMRAIILRVIDDYNSTGELHKEALDYLYAEDDDDYVFSFQAICKHLGFDPEKTRHQIMHAEHRISTRRRAA